MAKPKPKAKAAPKGKISPKALRDPGARSKIPTNKLPLKLRRQRMMNQRLNSPIAENSPYTYRQLGRDRSAAERLEFEPQENELKSALQGSKQRQGAIGSWFDQYRQQLAGAQQASGQIHQQAIQQNDQRAQQSEALAAQRRQEQEQAMREDAAKRGMQAQPMGDDSQAAASRMALQNAFSGMLGQANAANQNYFAGRQGVAGGAQLNERLKENMYSQGIEGKQQDLAGTKGAFRTDYDNKARQREQEYGLARGALGIKGKGLEAEIIDEKGKRGIARSKIRSDAKVKRLDQKLKSKALSEQQRHNLEMERTARVRALKKSSGGSRSGSMTDVQKRMYNDQFLKGLHLIRSKQNDEDFKKAGDSEIITSLTGKGVSSPLAGALTDWYRNKGTLSPQNAKTLDKYNVPYKRSRIRKK